MGKLADAWVEIGSFDKKLDIGLSSAHAKIEGFVGRANSLLGTIGIGLGAAGAIKFIGDMAEKGSNLNETMSKVKEVFGDSTNKITGLAEDMARQFGAVKTTTLDAAAMFGLIGQGAGFSEEKVARLSMQMVKLADDASSFYNVPLDVALQKIRAGLVGESEPLRAFGVMLDEAAVQSKALSMHLATTASELTNEAKVAARAQLIIEGLNKATGDHARTLDSYANTIRMVRGQWENWKAEQGIAIAGGLAATIQDIERQGVGSWTWSQLKNVFTDMNPGFRGELQARMDRMFGVKTGLPTQAEMKASEAQAQARIDRWQAENVRKTFQGPPAFIPEEFPGTYGYAGLIKQFVKTAPAAFEAFMKTPAGPATSEKMTAESFGSMAIQASLSASSPSAKLLEEQKRHGKILEDMLSALNKPPMPANKPGIFPRRGR